MTERNPGSLTIPVPHGGLEALWEEPDGELRGAALLCHPHPQYGGTMHTKAMYHLARAFNELGVATLRFNFRGVGASSGDFDEGRGERDDARAALDYLKERSPEVPLIMAGFSFGSLVGLSVVAGDPDVRALVGLGVPVTLTDVSFLNEEVRPLLILQAANDQFATPDQVREAVDADRDNVTLVEVPDTGHLFNGQFEFLRRRIREYFRDGPGRDVLSGTGETN